MAKALPRLAVLLEEGSRPPRAAPNVVAVLPATASHGAFVAVASQAVQRPAPLGRDDVFASAPAGLSALIQLHMYAFASPSRAQGEATQAPEMMLLHSVDIYEDDLQRLATHDAVRRPASASSATGTATTKAAAPAAAEAEALVGTAWVGPHFTGAAAARASDASPPAITTVEAVAWVGLEFVAVKTGQRQLLLVSSGLRPRSGAAASSSEDDDGDEDDEMAAVQAGLHGKRAVRTGFARVQDFCTAATTASLASGARAASVLVVAGLQRLTGVVCGGGGGSTSSLGAASPVKERAPPPVTEHAWKLGPFQHVAVSAAAGPPSGVVLCAASAGGSVEVYTWCVGVAHRATPPVCVHQVLMTAGVHVFYGVAVSAAVTSNRHEICFWVLGGERADVGDAEAAGGPGEGGDGGAGLPVLRGIDGHVLQVQPASPSAAKPTRGGAPGDELASAAAGPRVLNALWSPASSSTATPTGNLALPAQSVLQASPSFRLGVPPFLCATDHGEATAAPRGQLLRTRFVLVVRSTGEGLRPHWSSAVLPLQSPNCTAALAWLGATPSSAAAGVPPWTLLNGAVTRDEHELTLRTAGRVLRLGVRHTASLAAAETDWSLEVRVQGTHEVTDGHRLVGLATVPGCGEATPLLLLHGAATPVPTTEPRDKSDAVSSVYGQPLHKSSWALATDLRAVLVNQLQPWTPVRKSSDASPPRSSDGGGVSGGLAAPLSEGDVLAKVEALVAAEGARLQRHLDERLNRLEALLQRLAGASGDARA